MHAPFSKGYVVVASQYRGCGGSEGQDELGGSDVNDVQVGKIRSAGFLSSVLLNQTLIGHSQTGIIVMRGPDVYRVKVRQPSFGDATSRNSLCEKNIGEVRQLLLHEGLDAHLVGAFEQGEDPPVVGHGRRAFPVLQGGEAPT